MRIWREIIPPLVTTYALFAVVIVRAWRRPPTPNQTTRTPIRELAITFGGGYLVLLLLVAIFHVGLAREHAALTSAVVGGAFLMLVSGVVFACFGWLQARRGSIRA